MAMKKPKEEHVLAIKKIIEEMAWKRVQSLPEDKREAAFPKTCEAIIAELLEEN
jgi:hypothetical protein